MSREPRRYQLSRAMIFHLLNRGVLKQVFLHSADDYRSFLHAVKRAIEKAGAVVYHWCLMPNHYHIVTELRDPRALSGMAGGFQQRYAMIYHRFHGTAGRLFQSRFKSQAIEKEQYLRACGRYVERNPMRAGLVALPWDWPWSSARYYALGEADQITTHDPLLAGKSREWYREWLLEGSKEEEELFHGNAHAVGDPAFLRLLRLDSGRPVLDRRGRRRSAR